MMPEFSRLLPHYPRELPKFTMKQPVLCRYQDENGFTLLDEGFIVGILYDPTRFIKGNWVYLLAIYRFDYPNRFILPCFDYYPENELEAIALDAVTVCDSCSKPS